MAKKVLCIIMSTVLLLLLVACSPADHEKNASNLKETDAEKEAVEKNTEKSELMPIENSKKNKAEDGETSLKNKTFITNLSADPTTMNPVLKADDDGHMVYQNIFDGLLELNFNSEIIPGLAKTWDVSDDGKEYTFHLAKNVKWHDGVAFSSEDVKYTYEKIMAENGFIGETLKNALSGIECPDKDTVVLKLKEADSTLLGTLAWYEHFIIPKHIYENEKDWASCEAATRKPIGTGPFKFVSHKKGDRIVLEANEDYFKGAPKIDKLIFVIIPDQNTAAQAFYNGEIDLLKDVAPPEVIAMQKNPDIKLGVMTAARRYQLIFNMKNEVGSNFAIHKAIALGIDREEISKKGTNGLQKPAYGFYPPFLDWAYNDQADIGERNVEKAIKILEDAGFKKDKNGFYLDVNLDVFAGGTYADCAKVIQSNLKEIGINCKLNVMEMAAWGEKISSGNFEMAMMAGFQGPDPDALRKRVGTDQNLNFSMYSNADVDELLEKAKRLSKPEDRGPLYKEVQKILSDELPIIPIVEFASYYAVHKNISGVPYIDQVADVHDDCLAKVEIH